MANTVKFKVDWPAATVRYGFREPVDYVASGGLVDVDALDAPDFVSVFPDAVPNSKEARTAADPLGLRPDPEVIRSLATPVTAPGSV